MLWISKLRYDRVFICYSVSDYHFFPFVADFTAGNFVALFYTYIFHIVLNSGSNYR